MPRYYEAPDAENEPTIWQHYTDDWGTAMFRRCDLPPQARHLRPVIVEAVTR